MTKQVITKDPKAVERGKKGWEKQLEKIKAKHLEEIKNGGNDTGEDTGITGNDTGSTGNDTGKDTTLSKVNRYYYGGAGIALVAGIALLYFRNQKPEKTPANVPTRPKVSDDDFFRMN